MQTHWVESLKMEHKNTASEGKSHAQPGLGNWPSTSLLKVWTNTTWTFASSADSGTRQRPDESGLVNKIIRWSASPRMHSSLFSRTRKQARKVKGLSAHTKRVSGWGQTHSKASLSKTFYHITVYFWIAIQAFVLLWISRKHFLFKVPFLQI